MENPKRPTFLLILCILSFIAGAWGIFSGVTSYFAAGASSSVLEGVQQGIKEATDSTQMALDSIVADSTTKVDDAGAKMATEILSGLGDAMSEKNIKNKSLADILSSIITLVGAFLMFNLKKNGYWVYILGVIISIAAPIAIFGGGFMGLLSAGWPVFSGIIFSILYALNLKHMA